MLMKQKARLEEAAKAKEETKVHLDIRKNADCEIELRRRAGYRSGVRGQRLQRLAGGEDRKPGRMGLRGVRRDYK